MKNTILVCGRCESGTIKCSVELMPGKGGGDGTKPIVYELGTGAMQWLKEQEMENDNELDK